MKQGKLDASGDTKKSSPSLLICANPELPLKCTSNMKEEKKKKKQQGFAINENLAPFCHKGVQTFAPKCRYKENEERFWQEHK